MIDLYTIYTKSHEELFREFSRSLPSSVRLHAKFIDKTHGGSFQTNEFVTAIYDKLFFLKDTIKLKKQGEVILFCDVDIIVVRDFESDIRAALETNDMVFQDNTTQCNVGFWGIKCSLMTLEFMTDLCAHAEEDYRKEIEQTVINNLMTSDKYRDRLKFSKLGHEYFAIHLNPGDWQEHCSNAVIFHATNRALNQKMGEIRVFIGKINNSELNARLNSTSEITNYYKEKGSHMPIKTRLRIISILPFAQTVLGPSGVTLSEVRRVRFVPSPSNPLDPAIEKFRKDIPEAAVELLIADSTIWPEFEIDKDYWVDFTAV